jgi:hypothetical protein
MIRLVRTFGRHARYSACAFVGPASIFVGASLNFPELLCHAGLIHVNVSPIYDVNNLTLNPCQWFDSMPVLLKAKAA